MKFKEFETDLREAVEKWLQNWLKEHKENPEAYPLEMDEGDWWEQFQSSEF